MLLVLLTNVTRGSLKLPEDSKVALFTRIVRFLKSEEGGREVVLSFCKAFFSFCKAALPSNKDGNVCICPSQNVLKLISDTIVIIITKKKAQDGI